MKKCLLSLGLFFLIVFAAFSQSGYYFQSHFTPIENRRDQVNYAIEQDDLGRLYFANRQGLLHFDGSSWDLIETPGPTFAIQLLDSVIYLGGTYGFGKVTLDIYGNFVFHHLGDSSLQTGAITQLVVYNSSLAMTNGSKAFIFQPEASLLEPVASALPVSELSVFESSLLAINGDTTLLLSGTGALPAGFHENGPWNLWSRSAGGVWVGANAAQQLFILKGGQLSPLKLEDDGYISESRIISATWVADNLLAVGTLRGGVVFVDPSKTKVDQIVNFHTGLPDNETQTLFRDHDGGLWVAHPYGYTRISPDMPFKSYNYYPGLDGTLYTSKQYGDRVYAGTNLGLFYLDEVKNFDEIVYYIKKNPDTKLTVTEEKKEEKKSEGGLLSFLRFNRNDSRKADAEKEEPAATEAEPADGEKKKGGLFSFLKKNKDKEEEVAAETPQVAKKEENTSKPRLFNNNRQAAAAQPAKPVLVKKVKKELQSITYVYKKVKGVEGRINQLIPYDDNRLIAAGLAGVFIVQKDTALQVHSEAVRRVHYSKSKGLILVSTYRGSLLTITQQKGKWVETALLENLDDFIQYIFEDREGRIWLCTSQKLYWAKIADGTLADAGEVMLKNDYLDPVMGVDDVQLGVVFMHAKGFFRLVNNQLERIDWKGMNAPERYISSDGQLLISDGRFWQRMGNVAGENQSFPFLNVFDHIVSVDFEKDGDLWVVTADNNFYRIDHTKAFQADYNPFLRHIRSVNNQLLPIGSQLTVEQENSSLNFVFHQTEYSGILKVEYRYRLLGLNGEWSEWSPNNNVIQFPYLPADKYELQVETRNSFGAVKALESIYFTIVPPYWKRPWFYAAELLFFASLLLLSSRLTKSERMHVLIVNRVLTFLTIIMIIEFIQTLVEANFETDSSPVISFFLQVGVAFCLLPLESFMRNKLSSKSSKVDDLVQDHVSRLKKNIAIPGQGKKASESQ